MTGIAAHNQTTHELVETFRSRAEPVGTVVDHVRGTAEAALVIAAAGESVAAYEAMVSAELAAAAPLLIAALRDAGLESSVPASAAEALDRPLGLSLARRAVAETGSVVLAEPDLPDRSTALVTDFSITVCRTADLVRSLDDIVADLRAVAAAGGGGYATLVTGPSRTADIEMSLTVGVQGPKRVAVLFVDELG
jgi:L-lactate dehydrogenase complex protein LldG